MFDIFSKVIFFKPFQNELEKIGWIEPPVII